MKTTAMGDSNVEGGNCLCVCNCKGGRPGGQGGVIETTATGDSNVEGVDCRCVHNTAAGDSNCGGGDCLCNCGDDGMVDVTATCSMVGVVVTAKVGILEMVAMVVGDHNSDGGDCLLNCNRKTAVAALVSRINGTNKCQSILFHTLPNPNPTHSRSSSADNLLHTRHDNLAVLDVPARPVGTVDALEDVGTKMETEAEECPRLSDIGVVCKFYEGSGVAEGAAHFQLGGATNVMLHSFFKNLTVPARPVGTVDAHEDLGEKIRVRGG